jgi:hypothetical protein
MAKPTYQDATILLQLAELGNSSGLREAFKWMMSDKFVSDYAEFIRQYPPGSEEHARASDICGWFETVGAIYKHGLLNADLLFDWIAVSLVWDRIQNFARGERERFGSPSIYENFEAMAQADAEKG